MIKALLTILFSFIIPCDMFAATKSQEAAVSEIYRNMLPDCARARYLIDSLRQHSHMAKYELNLIEGDLNFNRGDYFEAIRYYKRSMADKGAKGLYWKKRLSNRCMNSFFALGDYKNTAYYAHQLERQARRSGDAGGYATALFFLGRVEHAWGHQSRAYQMMNEAVRSWKNIKLRDQSVDVGAFQMILVEYLQGDGRNEEALKILADVSRSLSKELSGNAQRRKDVLAHRAVLLYSMGQSESAAEYYRRFKTTGSGRQYNYACIMPYLRANKLYHDMVLFAKTRVAYLEDIHIVTLEMTDALGMLSEGYMGLGKYREATECLKRLSAIKHNIIRNDERNSIRDMSMLYDQKEKEMEQLHIDTQTYVIGVSFLVLCMMGLSYLGYHFYYKHKTVKSGKPAELIPSNLITPLQTSLPAEPAPADGDDSEERQFFERIRMEIIEKQLYLNADINREALMRKFHIPKNKFSTLFNKYAGMSYLRFINGLKLEYGAKMLKSHPNYTVEFIAGQCGMTAATFYRLFSKYYNMTPSEYREREDPNLS